MYWNAWHSAWEFDRWHREVEIRRKSNLDVFVSVKTIERGVSIGLREREKKLVIGMRPFWCAAVRVGICWGLFQLAACSLANETCEEPPITLEDGVKRHYTVGVLAIRGPERAFIEWNKTFSTYLTQTAGRRFDPPISFSMEALDFVTLYTAVS